jgi:hypothetical protein
MRKSKNKSKAMAKADKYFSLYIRERDSDEMGYIDCITCGKTIHKTEAHSGHFVSRSRQATRYDERNANGQCVACNTFRAGEQYLHGQAIDEKYGPGTADELMSLGFTLCRRTQMDFERIAEEYKNMLNE